MIELEKRDRFFRIAFGYRFQSIIDEVENEDLSH